MRVRILCLGVFVFCAFGLYAGDAASFVDFGFSGNGRYHAFAQYGVEVSTLKPWAELCIVDMESNDFVKDGKIFYRHDKEIEAGQDGMGALFSIVSKNTALAGKYGFDFLCQGVPLFISLENGHDPLGENIEFRDFDFDAVYRAELRPTVFSSGNGLRSSFTVRLERVYNGAVRSYNVGTPDVRRPLITSYTIKKALVSSDRKSMVFVVEMTRQGSPDEAPDIRYMVEAVRF